MRCCCLWLWVLRLCTDTTSDATPALPRSAARELPPHVVCAFTATE